MATPDRDTVYTNDGTNRTVYTRESNSTGWFVGIIVALALLAIAYLVFSANSQNQTPNASLTNTPAVTTTTPAAPATTTTPMAPADNATVTPTAPADTGTTAPSASAPMASSAPATASSMASSIAPATSSAAQ